MIDILIDRARASKNTCISVAVAHDEHVLEAVYDAIKIGFASFILVGNAEKIKEIANQHSFDFSSCEIINELDSEKACLTAVKCVSDGKANALMKGIIDTSIIMRAALDKDVGMRTGRKLSHLAVFKVPTYNKLLFVTDAAINIAPSLTAKREILLNAIEAVRNFGIAKPKVALLAAKEKPDDKMPVTLEYVELVKMAQQGIFGDVIMEGPLALDNAVSAEAVAIKEMHSVINGEADILMVPDIEAGNILYKSLVYFAKAEAGGVVLGAKRPIVLTSRSDSAESKLNSLAMSLFF